MRTRAAFGSHQSGKALVLAGTERNLLVAAVGRLLSVVVGRLLSVAGIRLVASGTK